MKDFLNPCLVHKQFTHRAWLRIGWHTISAISKHMNRMCLRYVTLKQCRNLSMEIDSQGLTCFLCCLGLHWMGFSPGILGNRKDIPLPISDDGSDGGFHNWRWHRESNPSCKDWKSYVLPSDTLPAKTFYNRFVFFRLPSPRLPMIAQPRALTSP